MAVSDAQKRANAKYLKEKVDQIVVRFYPSDKELYEFARSKGNVSEYIRELIRKDMED